MRLLPLALAAVALTPSTFAQFAEIKASSWTLQPTYAGVKHLSTGSWTNAPGHELIGSTLYNNTARQPYFAALAPGYEYGDYGRIPSPSSTTTSTGSAWTYRVKGFEFSYVTSEKGGEVEYMIVFYDKFRPCGYQEDDFKPLAIIPLKNLPGSPYKGKKSAWTVGIDLTHFAEFCMRADGGDGEFDDLEFNDSFGVGIINLKTSGGPGGPMLAGDPFNEFGQNSGDAFGSGTAWSGNEGDYGTGLGTKDFIWAKEYGHTPPWYCETIDNVDNTWTSFHFKLFGDLEESPCGSTFDDEVGERYCGPAVPNASGSPARMMVTGSTVATDNDLTLWAEWMPGNHNPGIFLMGSGSESSAPAGSDGTLCVGGGEVYRIIPRRHTDGFPSTMVTNVLTDGTGATPPILPGSTWNFQCWYRNDTGPSNMSDAVSVTFE